MPLWPIESQKIPECDFAKVVPMGVLAEFDGPLTFIFLDKNEKLMLAHLAALGVGVSRFLVSPTDGNTIRKLRSGDISIRRAIEKPGVMWVVDANADGSVIACWQQQANDLPDRAIPNPDILLTAELEKGIVPELRRAAVIEEEITALPALISDAMGLNSELKTAKFAESNSDGQIAIDGTPVTDHAIRASFWGPFCTGFDALMVATGNAKFPEIAAEGAFDAYFAMTSRSSYAIDIRLPVQQAAGSLFGDTKATTQAKIVLDTIAAMMTDETPPDEAIALINTSPNIRLSYGKLLEVIHHGGAEVVFRTKKQPSGKRLSRDQAGQRLKALVDLGFPFGIIKARGKLVGGLVRKFDKATPPTFYLEVDDKTHYTGAVTDIAVEKMKMIHFDDIVVAKIRVLTEGKAAQSYKLEDFDIARD